MPADPPSPASPGVVAARDATKNKARAAAGLASTQVTPAGGVTAPASTELKTALGG